MISPITTHVLDTSIGAPARGVRVTVECQERSKEWKVLARRETNADGRASDLLPENVKLMAGMYRLTFDSRGYFASRDVQTFYPYITIVFEVHDPTAQYHVPLLLSPYGYSTYRGS
ncbi:MAG TPA: hydroxyisourate hydrolase [Bacteroidota bacterium]|nr:hydroxyisourate hydrolase [Bacteroidota bacterium]